ncbi:tryptophan synthase subunit alpha [Candidatus Peribacteria bacterium RIFCSPLOWO2_01_FULL_51_18]|nr:MAG: tryptophan synthase subunit alpha [Candidatus Peribacteria bacterium RIFCSPHIGHO2_02_FULL_51_15]OGJ65288.1 MAG: tryptophan synthase subunit alpha [Candidatus Peribacteria bacterium RIFCSPLOWO2_01_FULL_51_18]OGJ69168.1 MAG: tryptophan synthase subunit alpha [Candidatus Peribacteria bacterium RIFCSPLOWO2_02_FULL_51_10]
MLKNTYREVCEKKGKPLFIPFVVLGDPDKCKTFEIIRTLIQSGADALELGLPFSDPPADGPVIQAADTRALRSGIRVDDCFDILKEIRASTDIPIGLLVYFNLVLQRGIGKFYSDCQKSGVSSVLIADLPLEHAGEVLPEASKHSIAPVFLISELTDEKRLEKICKVAGGYLYIVSYLGVTGLADSVFENKIKMVIKRARKYSDLPLFVGFGINTVKQAKMAGRCGADGVIVGSRIVREIPDTERIKKTCRMFSKVFCT